MSKQVIYLGSTANDGTGNKLREGGSMINSNFNELYSRNHACCGSKQEFRDAVLEFTVKDRLFGDFFYISKIVAGAISPYNAFLRIYEVDINRASNFTSAGTMVLKFYTQSVPLSSPKSGPEPMSLAGALMSPPTDFFGEIGIDWSKLTVGETYTCANWMEGGLYAVNTVKASSNPTGGGGDDTQFLYGNGTSKFNITEAATIDGSYDLYLASLQSGEITLAEAEVLKGKIAIKNIAGRDVTINCIMMPPISPSGSNYPAFFDGVFGQITIADKKQVVFYLYEINPSTKEYITIVLGDYTGVEL